MGKKRRAYKLWYWILNKTSHYEDLGINVGILKWILKKQDGSVSTWFIWLRIREQWWAVVNTVMNQLVL
jgi:hypothetical protein